MRCEPGAGEFNHAFECARLRKKMRRTRHDLERFRSLMRAEIRDRIALFDGALDLPPEKALHSLAG